MPIFPKLMERRFINLTTVGTIAGGFLLLVAQMAAGATFSGNNGGLLGNSSVINSDNSGDYVSLQAAALDFTASTATVNGDYTFYIASDLSEPNQCAFGKNTNGYTVTLKPAPGITPTITFTGTTQNNNSGTFSQTAGCPGQIIIGLKDLTNNATALNTGMVPTDNFEIDGSNTVSGTTRDLTVFTPANGLINSRSIHVLGSNNFVVKNCNIVNQAGGPAFGVYVVTYKIPISSSAATTAVYTPTGSVVDNCYISVNNGSSAAIYFNGLFDGQVTANPTANGFPANVGASGYIIRNNVVQGMNRTIALNYALSGDIYGNTCSGHSASSAFSGIGCSGIAHINSIGSTGWTINIYNNIVSGLLSTSSNGEAGIVLGVSTDTGSGTYNVYNNAIAGLADSQVGVNAVHNGILARSATSIFNILHNSINVIDVSGLTSSGDNAAAIAITAGASRTTATTVLKNNLIRTAQHGGSGLDYTPTSAANLTTDGNDVFTSAPSNGGTTPKFGRFGGADEAALSDWQLATAKEANGKTLDPAATSGSSWSSVSATNLHFSPSGVPPVGLVGVTGTGITTDIDSQTRSASSPIAGADEIAPNITYSPTTLPSGLSPTHVTATLSESATDFDGTDVSAQNGTISNFTGSGSSYSFDLTPTTSSGTMITTPLGAYHDADGRPSLASTYPGSDETETTSTADLRFDVCSFCCNCAYPVHFCQDQFDHLNFVSTNGHYIAMGADTYRSQIVAHGNVLAAYHNDLNTSYTVKTPAEKALEVNQYVQSNCGSSGPAPVWLLMNEISSGLWPSNQTYRTWVCDVAHELKNTYGFNVIMFAPFSAPTANDADWTRLGADAYIGVENYLSGEEIQAQNFSVSWCQAQYQTSITNYTARGVPRDHIFLTEEFQETVSGTAWGRSGVSVADWIHAITVRQTAAQNIAFSGYITYDWSHNNMSATDDELLQFEDAYAGQSLPVPVRVSLFRIE